MKIPYNAPPDRIKTLLGAEVYDYFERLQGAVMGVGVDDQLGALDLANLGIRNGKKGQLVTVDDDGVRTRVVEPLIEDVMKAKSSGFLTADEDGNVSTTRVEFPTPTPPPTSTPAEDTAAITVGVTAMQNDWRRYALLVS